MAAGGLVRSQSRIALEVKNLLSQQQASEPGSKHAQATATQARTEGGESLRNLRVPASIIDHFVAIAYENTLANRETCGLLMGPARNLTDPNATSLVVTHLTIPKQSATPDTCTTEHEEEIMQFQDEAQVVTLGWIHTHPSQTCFMSSLDLHTHASYQMMLPEAIAIVCAPNDNPSFGLFRLTSPPGLQTVISCRQPGLFHPHIKPDGTNIPALYTDAWGHVTLEQADQLEIVDLRTR
ncbi:JAB1/MPN domain-containing protein [Tilletiaria anomala UBC 951]|uniref:JAB1/MPN domain-containing protein n=1 Tax=Tilletiaria anomala (strain ATCC 24038 / CBS 436.72 / UBC 951) TaxID=1037660 RepID=A0A066W7M1_TILAU|nr:JAB1/MPN domain-containing protein [Tilletiaria anomala UBC 951]KDN48538.1 JAB1/MPN domain-containing protein [Tilletiaria anomala UBC 951]